MASSLPCLQRLLLQLSLYDVNIEYLKGKENIIADVLSRDLSLPISKQDEHHKDIIPVHMLTTEIPADSTSVAEFRKAIPEDTTSGLLIQAVINGWPESKKDCHPLLVDYWTYREEISAHNGLLFKEHRLIVPEKFHNRNIQTIHEEHSSVEKMQLRAKSQHSGQR